jgi:tripartite motif-containing protein 71
LGLVGWPAGALAEGSSSAVGSSLLSSGSPVIEGSPTEAEQRRAAEEARLASPEAVRAREASELAYSGLSPTESRELAARTFPALVDEPNGGAPKLPEGARISSFSSEFTAAVELPHGGRGTLESVSPIAVNTSSGTVPVDLAPRQAGSGFEASTPADGMHVRAGGKLSEGVSLSDLGVTLTPVTEGGTPLEGNRSLDGASIFYGNSENAQAGISDTDSLIKFDAYGFSEETILRSDRAPQRLYFRVGLPEGASLIQAPGDPSLLQVVDAGQVIAQISAPSGRDAEGTLVPVGLTVSGDTVTLGVEHQPGQYRLPIEVDPTTYDTQVLAIHNGLTYQSRWKAYTSSGKEGPFYFSEGSNFGIRDLHGENTSPGYAAGEWGGFAYATQGESSIYDVHVTSSLSDGGHGFEARANLTNIVKTGKNEPSASHLDSYSEGSWPGWELCMLSGCAVPTEVTSEIAENSYSLLQYATRTGNYYMDAELWGAWVYIVQTKNSTVSFDTTDSEVAGIPNALYGSEHWVRGGAGVVKGLAKDPGIGISELDFSSANESKWGISEPFMYPSTALCQGVICPSEETRAVSLSGLPDGKDTVTFSGQNATDTKALAAKVSATVYVDSTVPRNIALFGLPTTKEVGGGEYKLTAEATDGTAPTPSSGMKSMALLIDGKEVGSLATPCSPGPCTAHSGTWAIFGHSYATGRHTVTVQATDNAGNTSSESFVMVVHPASPVAMGPGAVNPLSGELSLSASDVSMPGGLTVSRSYGSQHLTTGENGPVSAQWGFSLGSQESLIKQPDGSMVLIDASGAQTIFSPDGKGGYVSPAGDANLTLSSAPCEAGQTEFMLKNAAAATTTCFKVPAGGTSEVWTPSIAKGAVATDTVTYAYQYAAPHQAKHEYSLPAESGPHGVTVGPDGDLWFTDEGTNRIGKSTTAGTITEYVLPAGSKPMGITAGPDGNLWFTDQQSSKIGKITTAGTVTEYAVPSAWPEDIAAGPDGNLWFAGRSKIGKITTSGVVTEYAVSAGPTDITAGPDGDLWFTTGGSGKIGKITTSGAVTEYLVSGYLEGLTSGSDGNVWYTNFSNDKIGKITTAGSVTEYALPSGSLPTRITGGPEGNLWFTDSGTSKIGSITTTGAIVEYSAGTSSEPEGIVTGPDKNLWFTERLTSKIAMLAPPEPGAKAILEPTEALAPVPAGVSCSPELKAGCRALTFNYAESTTATGEAQSQWGDYNGRLTRVYYTAYDPVGKTMKTVEVAHYLYDNHARVRSEWDPRISPGLKTVYGYDSEGHVTALTMPGQESWAFSYGTIASDTGAGRLLKADQAKASASLWNGETTKNTEAPKLTGSAFVGTRMTVSDGTWTASPVLYGYQWERCNTSGKECVAIPGATNANYTPVTGDEGHTLVAQVTGTNGGGSLSASSVASGIVKAGSGEQGAIRGPQPGTTIEYGVQLSGTGLPNLTKSEVEKWAQKDIPTEASAVFPADEPQGWPASDYRRATLYYRDSTSRTVNVATPSGGVSTSEYNEGNEVTRSLTANNRAVALKEDAKSAEVSQTLDTQSTYSVEGTELLSTLGPQHTVKLAGGGEVQARNHTVYSYDEGAPSEGGPYRLVTRTTQGAQFAGKEEDVRTTRTYYSGQKGLGWTLRKPTSVVTDPTGLDLVHTTVYNETTGSVIETKSPGGSVESVYPPTFSSALGTTEGSGSNQFNHPEGSATDSSGNLWVDDKGNHRLQKFSSAGELIGSYGSAGKGEGQFENAWGIAINQSTNEVFVGDYTNDRISVFSNTGTFLRMFGTVGTGNGQLNGPVGLTIDSHGNVWVADDGNNRIEEFSSTGTYLSQFGKLGSGNGEFKEPLSVAICEGELFVVDHGNNRIQEFSRTGEYLNQFGSEGTGNGQFKKPEGIAVDPMKGNLYVSDEGNERIEEFSPAGRFLTTFGAFGEGVGGLHGPTGLAMGPTGKIYIADQYNARIDEWLPPEAGGARMTYSTQFGGEGSGGGHFSLPVAAAVDGSGKVWVTDYYNGRVQKFSATGEFLAAYGSKGTGNGQFTHPTGIGINQSTGNVYVGDCGNSRIEELNSSGGFVRTFGSAGTEPGQLSCMEGVKIDSSGNVWVADKHNNRVQEFSSTGTFIAAYGSLGSGNGQFNGPEDIAFSGGNMYVTDFHNNRVQELSMTGAYIKQFGSEGGASGQFKGPEAIVTDAAGNLYVDDNGNARIEEFKASGGFLATFGSAGTSEGQMSNPLGLAINAGGDLYVVDSANNRVDIWMPANQAVHDTKTIYYTAKGEAEVEACRNHPEWANLLCLTEPAAQPETENLPPLLATTMTYNMFGEPLVSTSTSGSSTRTSTNTYDGAGRPLTVETTASTGTALPKTTNKYSETTGALVEQSTNTLSIKSVFNNIGQLTSYTDADGNITTLEYEPESAARLKKINDGKGIQTLTYDETTGQVKELIDSAAGAFTAGYDPEGNLTSEGYPNGMTATYTLNAAGEQVGLVYKKETHCTEKCEWFTDSVVPSIHGQWLSQTSSLGKDAYTYDPAGRLVESQATPTGSGCVTRRYAYDEETNRTSLSTYQPNIKGECAIEAGTSEKHTYDPADRLTDPGTSYDAFGNTTSLAAADAGGSELKNGFYVDNQLATQTQAGETIGYNLDPAGRTREIVSTGKIVATEVQHYTGPGNTPAWTGETSGNWRRNISTMTGLTAIQHDSEAPILQLTNLHGDIIATATTSETATGLASTIKEASDYGVPASETPPRYSWLGAHEIPTELPSGVTGMGVRSYVPQLGRFLQTDPRPGGSANAYAYVFGDPINTNDLTGEYTWGFSASLTESLDEHGHELAQAYEAELRAEAERKAREAAQEAAMLAAFETEGPEEEWEEEGGEEYAAWHHPAGTEHQTGNTEEGLLYQSLGEEPATSEVDQAMVGLARRCQGELHSHTGVSQHGACARYVDLCHHNPFGGCGRLVKQSRHSNFSRCEVDFAGHCSTAGQVYRRYKEQVTNQRKETSEWIDIIKCAIARGNCPDG